MGEDKRKRGKTIPVEGARTGFEEETKEIPEVESVPDEVAEEAEKDVAVVDDNTKEVETVEDTPTPPSEELKTVAEVFVKADAELPKDTVEEPKAESTKKGNKVVITVQTINKEAINEIVKDDTLSLFDKLDKLAKLLPQLGERTIKSLVYLFKNRAERAEGPVVNSEQRAFVRSFRKLLALPQSEFNAIFRYVKYAFDNLTNPEVVVAEGYELHGKLSPLDPLNQMMYLANKDDAELKSFLFLFTALSVKKDYPGQTIKADKVSVPGAISDDELVKLNEYYSANVK